MLVVEGCDVGLRRQADTLTLLMAKIEFVGTREAPMTLEWTDAGGDFVEGTPETLDT